VVGLVAENLAWLHTSDAKTGLSNIGFNITINETSTYDTAFVAHLPIDVRTGSYWLMLAAGIGGFIDALLLGGMQCWRRLKSASLQVEHGEVSPFSSSSLLIPGENSPLLGPSQLYDHNLKPQTPLSIFIAIFALCRSLAASTYAFQEWAASGTFTPQEYLPLTSSDRYNKDFFTPDAWNCQYEDYVIKGSEGNKLENLCQGGTAARTVTLAVTVLYAFVLYGILYRAYKRRSNGRRTTQFSGFVGANTMRSHMSEAPTVVGESNEPKTPEK
jgi:hypothetical protein